MGELTFRPDELHSGAQAFDQHAEMLVGHARSIEQVAAALPSALQGVGMSALPGIQARVQELMGHFETAHERTANAGSMLRDAATGSTAIDAQGGAAMGRG
ncbi:hypothetical protein [Labedaea rhizosphaerae]|uniref:Excreted virulence factor EspC (Type VII ESX diderm) n=1 Tax=Labedaea rhizosphaerae TaxID=598644 RepID=A0A4R6SLZ6_LABRH|nr:hypothetical protein [Labedaea rhizosphaerae]TDQ04914.1 hypothetical protein EV186_101875 [Labedaea rhizosphaerae]